MNQQGIIPYSDERRVAEALTYVYIAQYVRPDGPKKSGVLKSDCQIYSDQIERLRKAGDVRDHKWRGFKGFVTTRRGTKKAQAIIGSTLAAEKTRIESELAKIPPRCLQYFQDGIFANDRVTDEGRVVQIDREIGRKDIRRNRLPAYWCLLSNTDIGDMRDRLFQFLRLLRLVAKAYRYVSTGDGEETDHLYVPAQELQSFFREYLAKVGITGHLWPDELEDMHSVYHILTSSNGRLHAREELNRRIPVWYRESVDELVDECLARNVLTESTHGPGRPYLKVNDIVSYDTERKKRYQNPLVDFLLEENTPPSVEVVQPYTYVGSKGHPEASVKEPSVPVPKPSIPIKVGNLLDNGQDGLLGRIDNRDVVLDLYQPHAITVLGVQGSGKSYAAGVVIEMAARIIPGISKLTKPLSCIIFHFSKEENRVPEWIGLAFPNSSPSQTKRLKDEYGASPCSIANTNINVLVPPTKLSDRRKQYPGFNVMPLGFSPSKLKADDWQRLLTFGKGSDALYMETLKDLMIDLRDKKADFGQDDLKDEIAKSDLSQNQKKFALQRIKTIGRWLSQDGQPFADLLKPGVVNIVDLRDPLAVDAGMASLVLQTFFSFVKDRPSEGICLVAIDEAHLFFEHEHLTKEIIEFVALLRKGYRMYLLLMSQQPGRFHPDILALSDVIICYRLESDTELDFLKKNKPDFADVTKDIKKLKTGEGKAFLWARVSTDDVLEKPRLISVRPKVTEDRGKTATAF